MSIRAMRATIGAIALALLFAVPSLAYEAEVEVQVDVSGPSRAVCPTAVSATVTVVDRDGKPLAGIPVTWSTGATGVTDASGQHTVTVNLTGSLTVEATAQGATGSLVIQCVEGDVLGSVGLPRTDTAPDRAPLPLLGLAVVAILGAAAGTRRLIVAQR